MARRAAKAPGASTETELNLVPIMNLVVCLIPIVLLGASLVKVGVINVQTPRFGPLPGPCDSGCEAPLNLRLSIDEAGFTLEATGEDLPSLLGQPPGEQVTIARVADALDFVALYAALTTIKEKRPDETTMVLSAQPGVPWREVVNTMDVSRMRLEADRYDTAEALAAASVRRGEPADQLLWPDVMLAVAH